jgi:hypothetical protein
MIKQTLLPVFTALAMLVGGVDILGIVPRAAAADASQPQYYELRVYATKSAQQQKLVSDYWQNAAVPAYHRQGIQPIGVFTELDDSPSNSIYVLIPYDSPGAYATVPAALAADAAYQQAAAAYLAVPKSDPAFVRFESSLLVAFDTMKHLAVPPSAADKQPWVFELRMYQSHSESRGIAKVQMFNSGETDVMKAVGLNPVFFGQAVVGPQLPRLVYMLSGENVVEHKKHFQAFQDSPVWKKLSADPQYRDAVSKVTSVVSRK